MGSKLNMPKHKRAEAESNIQMLKYKLGYLDLGEIKLQRDWQQKGKGLFYNNIVVDL